jgi:hypothetical protein
MLVPASAARAGGDYIYVEDTDRLVAVHRGRWMIYGTLTADGDLVPDFKQAFGMPTSQGNLAALKYSLINDIAAVGDGRRPVYELKAGRLIKGVMLPTGSFVPDAGSAVTKLEDYDPTGLPIWNLPGHFMSKDKFEERRKWLSVHAGTDPKLLAEKARLDAAAERLKI